MKQKLVISKMQNRIMTFQFEEDTLVSINASLAPEETYLNNIYVAKVKDVVKNIQAAFVEIQPGKKCYLPLSDSKEHIVEGAEILVQVIKDAVKTKEPTVTTKLSIAGKYMAISYPDYKIGYSNKLSSNEKKNLKTCFSKILKEHVPTTGAFGYVIRTSARELLLPDMGEISQDSKDILLNEMIHLTEEMQSIISYGKNRAIYSVLYQAPPSYLQCINHLSSNNSLKLITDDTSIYQNMLHFTEQNAMRGEVILYDDKKLSIDKLYRLNTLLSEALSRKVWLKSGGYLIIEPTEALVVIDVNSGKYDGKKNFSDAMLQVNMEAAYEIARQLRIRNMSGMILVDFINMKEKEQELLLLQTLRNEVKKDALKTKVIDITPLGLVEITRKKVEPPLWEQIGKSHEIN